MNPTEKKKSAAVEITDGNFKELISKEGVVMVDFWAAWCGPCKMIAPIVEELATDYEGKAVIGKLDVDQNPQASMEFGVRSIPTVLFFKDGKLVKTQVGAAGKQQYVNIIEEHLA